MPPDTVVDALHVRVLPDGRALGAAAATHAATVLRDAIAARGVAHAMFATGNSQLAFLGALVEEPGVDEPGVDEQAVDEPDVDEQAVDWTNVVGFHMDEYVGIAADHPASFRRYLRERLVTRVPFRAFHYVEGDAPDPGAECARYARLLREHPLDLCCLGIGENGHLAFNDPPVADFEDPLDVKVVTLDDACRRQQVGEGHFPDVDAVPLQAITVTIPALLRAATVLAIVPEARKREPVRRALEGPVTTACPASILREQAHATLYLDADSAGGIDGFG
jgi:glucosamine-6-phosphate deaminase